MSRGKSNPPIRYKLVSDESGHEYIIEAKDESNFYKWVEATEEGLVYDGMDFEIRRMNRNNLTFLDPQGWK